jgi:SAM-dependent methyltransferase
VAALGEPLPYDDAAFDVVVSSLVLHYLEDWGPALAELRRVLRPGGRLVAAVHHPFVDYAVQDPRPDYHAVTSWTEDWTFGGRTFPMTFWRRPLHAMTDAFTAAGFRLSVISEPQPDPAARELFPEEFHDFSTRMTFLFLVVEAPTS